MYIAIDTIYNHLLIGSFTWSDKGCIFDSFQNKYNINQYQMNDNKETPNSNSFIWAKYKRIGVG